MLVTVAPSPLQQWKQRNHEDLLEPTSGLIQRGESTLTAREYTRLAARRQLPASFRFRHAMRVWDQWIKTCNPHTYILAGEDTREMWSIAYPRHLPLAPFDHVHEVRWDFSQHMPQWRCELKDCGQRGCAEYTIDTIASSYGRVYYRCTDCGDVISFPAISGGAPNTFYVDPTVAGPGAGTSINPYRLLESARAVMAAANGDTARCRTGTLAENFDGSHMFPAGTSLANVTTITRDLSSHVPTLRPTSAVIAFVNSGSAQQYIDYVGLSFSLSSPASNGTVGAAIQAAGGTAATAAHHLRIISCSGSGLNADSGYITFGKGHHNQVLSSLFASTTGVGLGAGVHAMYFQGADNLADGNETTAVSGYGVHAYAAGGGPGSDTAADRCNIRNNNFHNDTTSAGRGILCEGGTSLLVYNNVLWGCRLAFTVLRVNGANTVGVRIFGNTVSANPGGGINLAGGSVGTVLRDNISTANTNFDFDGTGGSGTDFGSPESNSWRLGSFTPAFVSPATGDFRIQSTSTARDAGVDTSALYNSGTYPLTTPVDKSGFIRTSQGSAFDLGAFEFVGTPVISLSPASLNFTTTEGTNPASQSVLVNNSGALQPMPWRVTDNQNWVSESPTSASDVGSFNVSVNVAGLVPGVYNATLTVTADAASNSPQLLPVTLTVLSAVTQDLMAGCVGV